MSLASSSWSTSTQCRYWLFSTPDDIKRLRIEANRDAVRRFEERSRQPQTLNDGTDDTAADTSAVADNTTSNKVKRTKKPPSPPTADEENALLLYYTCAVTSLADKFSPPLPEFLQSTVIAYMKRFYLYRSAIDYHPLQIMIAALLVATKSEEYHISTATIAAKTKSANQNDEAKQTEMTRLEVPLLEGIRFHLKIYHPNRPLIGWIQTLREHSNAVSPETWAEVESAASRIINISYRSDAMFLHSHSQIALAAVHRICKERGGAIAAAIEQLLTSSFTSADKLRDIRSAIAAIDEHFTQSLAVDQMALTKQARLIDAKLKKCMNAALDPNSSEYAKASAEQLRLKQLKKEEKLYKRRFEEEKKIADLIGPPLPSSSAAMDVDNNGDDDDGEAGGFTIIKRARTDDNDPIRRRRMEDRLKLIEQSKRTGEGFGPSGFT